VEERREAALEELGLGFSEARLEAVSEEMARRRGDWRREYRLGLDSADQLAMRDPQAVIEFVPEIVANMRKEERRHMYPENFLENSFQREISDRYRQYLVDWLAELHYKFKLCPETLYVTVGIIDKTLMRWRDFEKSNL
jgi:hypothetical protein